MSDRMRRDHVGRDPRGAAGADRVWAVLVIAGALLVAAGLWNWGSATDRHQAGGGGALGGPVLSGPASAVPATSAEPPAAAPARWKPGAPRQIRLPALGVTAPVDPVGLVEETLVPPGDASRVGWWADGALPGASAGSVLLAGHTVRGGAGALQRISELRAGDELLVRTETGRLRYQVKSVRTFGKGALAARAQQLFAQQGPPRLVLVTCSDCDGTSYLINVVVTAVPDR